MEKKYSVTPVTKLTDEIIDSLTQHSTLSSLRRACAYSPCIIKVDATESVPTLYYVKGDVNPEIDDWTIHALTTDLITYLLKDSADNSDPGPVSHDGTIKILSPNTMTSLTDTDGRIDISNEVAEANTEDLQVEITMDDTEATYTGKVFYDTNTEGQNMTVNGNKLTAVIDVPEGNFEIGTQINFKVTDDGGKIDTFVIGYGHV